VEIFRPIFPAGPGRLICEAGASETFIVKKSRTVNTVLIGDIIL
jgi:hypothetical protein